MQFFLNHVKFSMDLQAALYAPTVHSEHVPSSFYPRAACVVAESCLPGAALAELRRRGHQLELLEQRQGAGHPLRRGPRRDSRGGFGQGHHRLRAGLVTVGCPSRRQS